MSNLCTNVWIIEIHGIKTNELWVCVWMEKNWLCMAMIAGNPNSITNIDEHSFNGTKKLCTIIDREAYIVFGGRVAVDTIVSIYLSIYCGISGDGSGDWWRLNTHTRYIFGMRRDSESSTKAIDIEVARWLIPCYLIYRKMSYIFDCVNTSVRHVLCAVTHLSHCLHDTYHT